MLVIIFTYSLKNRKPELIVLLLYFIFLNGFNRQNAMDIVP